MTNEAQRVNDDLERKASNILKNQERKKAAKYGVKSVFGNLYNLVTGVLTLDAIGLLVLALLPVKIAVSIMKIALPKIRDAVSNRLSKMFYGVESIKKQKKRLNKRTVVLDKVKGLTLLSLVKLQKQIEKLDKKNEKLLQKSEKSKSESKKAKIIKSLNKALEKGDKLNENDKRLKAVLSSTGEDTISVNNELQDMSKYSSFTKSVSERIAMGGLDRNMSEFSTPINQTKRRNPVVSSGNLSTTSASLEKKQPVSKGNKM